MQPLLVRLKEGPFFTLLAGVTSMLGILVIGVIRRKGMAWRLHQEHSEAKDTDTGLPCEHPLPIK